MATYLRLCLCPYLFSYLPLGSCIAHYILYAMITTIIPAVLVYEVIQDFYHQQYVHILLSVFCIYIYVCVRVRVEDSINGGPQNKSQVPIYFDPHYRYSQTRALNLWKPTYIHWMPSNPCRTGVHHRFPINAHPK